MDAMSAMMSGMTRRQQEQLKEDIEELNSTGEILRQVQLMSKECFSKCNVKPAGDKLGPAEEKCLRNCGSTFLQSAVYVVERISEVQEKEDTESKKK